MAISKPSKNPLSLDLGRKDRQIMAQWQQLTRVLVMVQRAGRRHKLLKVRENA